MRTEATAALVRAAWSESWNRRIRFSPAKVGIWLAMAQVALGALALWRSAGAAGQGSLALAAGTMAAQAGLWSFCLAFLNGREKLYGARSLALLHVSPAPPFSQVMALSLASLPRRLWSMLIWSVMLTRLLPGAPGLSPARAAAAAGLWVLGIVVGTLGELAGLVGLMAWARWAPRALGAVWVIVLLLQAGAAWYLIYLLAAGLPAGAVRQAAAGLRWWAPALAVAIFAGPALWLAMLLLAAPHRVGEIYKEGWLRLAELGDGSARPRRSAWPALAPGAAGALQARDWLAALRNPVTWFRAAGLAALLVALVPARPLLARLAAGHHDWTVLGTGAGLFVAVAGEMAAAAFSGEGGRVGLWAVCGVGPGRALAGKLLAALPFALLQVLVTIAVGAGAGDPGGALARDGLLAAAIALGSAAVAVGAGALDADAGDQAERPELEAVAALLEQVPRGPGGTVGLVASALFAAGAVWASGSGALSPIWSPWIVWPLLLLLPAAALTVGYRRLRHQLVHP